MWVERSKRKKEVVVTVIIWMRLTTFHTLPPSTPTSVPLKLLSRASIPPHIAVHPSSSVCTTTCPRSNECNEWWTCGGADGCRRCASCMRVPAPCVRYETHGAGTRMHESMCATPSPPLATALCLVATSATSGDRVRLRVAVTGWRTCVRQRTASPPPSRSNECNEW